MITTSTSGDEFLQDLDGCSRPKAVSIQRGSLIMRISLLVRFGKMFFVDGRVFLGEPNTDIIER